MSSDNRAKTEGKPSEVMFARSDFIAVAAAACLLGGFFVPIGRVVFDILWGCNLCLSAALLLIAFSAKSSADLRGFSLVMVLGALGRMVLYSASAKLIFHNNTAGTLIETIGGPLAGLNPVFAIIVPPVAAVIVLICVFRAARRITDISFTCITETIPLKQVEIETDLKTGIINSNKGEELKERYFHEAGFYLNMAGVAKLLCCDAVIALLVILAIVGGPLIMSSANNAMSETLLHVCAVSAAGAAVLILSPILVIAVSSSCLVGKSSKTLIANDSDDKWKPGETIEIVSEETGRTEKVELLNPDFAQVAENTQSPQQSMEKVVEFEPVTGSISNHSEPKPSISRHTPETIEDYYDSIAARICDWRDEGFCVLLAGTRDEALPVTIAVNVSIHVCRKHLRTLLIDTESNRNAIAEVFEVEHERSVEAPVTTFIENLSIWSCRAAMEQGNLREEINRVTVGYDRVIIYAPRLEDHASSEALAQAAETAVVFAPDSHDYGRVRDILQSGGCEVLATMSLPNRD